jgi:hypothetical protein
MKTAFLCTCLLLLLITFSNCNNYYKAITYTERPHDNALLADSLLKEDKYFILRTATNAFSMTKPGVNTTGNTISFYPTNLPAEHSLYLKKGRRGKSIPEKTTGYKNVLNEVHLYVGTDIEPSNQQIVLSFDKVSRMDVLQKDSKRTTGSYILGGVVVTAGILLIVSLVGYIGLSTMF